MTSKLCNVFFSKYQIKVLSKLNHLLHKDSFYVISVSYNIAEILKGVVKFNFLMQVLGWAHDGQEQQTCAIDFPCAICCSKCELKIFLQVYTFSQSIFIIIELFSGVILFSLFQGYSF